MDFKDTKVEMLISMDAENDEKQLLSLKKIIEKGHEMIKAGNRSFINAEIDREAMSIILYTSGTTGMGKGVMLSHRNIATNVQYMGTLIKVEEEDRFFSVLVIGFRFSSTLAIVTPLILLSPNIFVIV